jgi:V/A-type H+-transporting ATPase subunit I
MGTIPSLILMNLIAMTFEFMSSGVQSLRLLYYEFMGKFYNGSGVQFRPFRSRIRKS